MNHALCLVFLTSVLSANAIAIKPYEYVRPVQEPFEIIEYKPDVSLNLNEIRINGVVKCGGTAIAGAHVFASTKFHAVTDQNGKFSLVIDLAESDDTLTCEATDYPLIDVPVIEFKRGYDYSVVFHLRSKDPENYLVKKPVIYCSSDFPVDAVVKVFPKGELSFAYPGNDANWEITIDSDGITACLDNRRYPYLFWEAKQSEFLFNHSTAAIINTDTLVRWFEQQLLAFGFNEKEQTDFITFWAPQAAKYTYIEVNWVIDADCDGAFGQLLIDPSPDFLRRVYFVFSEYTQTDLVESEENRDIIKLTDRYKSGFRVLEWGGMEFQRRLKQL